MIVITDDFGRQRDRNTHKFTHLRFTKTLSVLCRLDKICPQERGWDIENTRSASQDESLKDFAHL